MKNRIGILITAILMCCVMASCSSGDDISKAGKKTDKVIIGTQTMIGPEAIARVNGWLQEEIEMEVEVVFFDAGRDVINAMASKSIDIGFCGSVPASIAIANGVECKVIYIQTVLGTSDALVVRSDLGITEAKELIGKTIATTFASTAHYSLLKYLEVNSVNPTDVDVIDMKASEIVAAYTRGDVDGAFTWDPNVTLLIGEDGFMLTHSGIIAEYGYPTMDVNLVDNDFAERNPDVVRAYIQCMERAVELYINDPVAASEAWAIDSGLMAEECLVQSKGITFLPIADQQSAQWFGSTSLADKLFDTGIFLYEQESIASEPSFEIFKNAVTGNFLN